MQYKVTKQHFEYFKKRCEYWIQVFGLKNWRVNYRQTELNDGEYSALASQLSGYVATAFLSKESHWPVTKDSLDETALHEVVHLAHGRFRAVAKHRYVSEEEIDEADEEVTRLLVNVIRRSNGKGK